MERPGGTAERAVCGSVSEAHHRGLGPTTQASVTRALAGSVSGPGCGSPVSLAPRLWFMLIQVGL